VRAVLAAFPLARFPTRRLVSLCSEPEASALYTSMSANREMRARLYPVSYYSEPVSQHAATAGLTN